MTAPADDLGGRKALVLGAGSDAGREIAVALARAGADVAVAASSLDGEEVMASRRTRRAVEALGRRSAEYAFDVTLGQNVQVSTRQVSKELGGLDILVYAVSTRLTKPLERVSDAEWTRALAVNLSGAFFAARAALREMRQGGWGRMVFVADLLAAPAPADSAAPIAAQYGLAGLARSLAADAVAHGEAITANVITLGSEEDPDREPLLRCVSAAALGDAANVGGVAVRLCAEEGGRFNGQVVCVR